LSLSSQESMLTSIKTLLSGMRAAMDNATNNKQVA